MTRARQGTFGHHRCMSDARPLLGAALALPAAFALFVPVPHANPTIRASAGVPALPLALGSEASTSVMDWWLG